MADFRIPAKIILEKGLPPAGYFGETNAVHAYLISR
jgi:hypothetical protein